MSDLLAADLDNAPCGFLIFSDAGTVTGINNTLVQLLGYDSKEEIAGKSFETLLTIAGRIFYQTHFFPLIRLHGHANEIFFSLKTKQKNELPVICNAIRKNDGDVATNHCIFLPVTERRKYEQELLDARKQAERALEENHELVSAKSELEMHSIELDRQLNRLTRITDDIGQFSKVISHDLQESIRKIALFSDSVLVEARQTITPDRLKDLKKIGAECTRLRQLATDLDKFISLNINTEKPKRLDMNLLLRNAYAHAAKQRSNMSFTSEPLPEIEGFEKQISLLFRYILEHCLEYSNDSTPLIISVECSVVQQNSFRTIKGKYKYVDFAKIVVTDNANCDRQLDASVFKLQKKAGEKHINFALPFYKKIVDNHHGDIRILARNGPGAEITILLPVVHSH